MPGLESSVTAEASGSSLGKRVCDLLDEFEALLQEFFSSFVATNANREAGSDALSSLVCKIIACNATLTQLRSRIQERLNLEHTIESLESFIIKGKTQLNHDIRLVNRAIKRTEDVIFDAEQCMSEHRAAQLRPVNTKRALDYAFSLGPFTSAPHNIRDSLGLRLPVVRVPRNDSSSSGTDRVAPLPQVQVEQWPAYYPYPIDADINQSVLFHQSNLVGKVSQSTPSEAQSSASVNLPTVPKPEPEAPKREQVLSNASDSAQVDLDLDLEL